MRLIFSFFLLIIASSMTAQEFYPWSAQAGEKVLRIDVSGKTATLLTSRRILQLEGNAWKEKWASKTELTAAARVGDIFWLGSLEGLAALHAHTWKEEIIVTPAGTGPLQDIAAVESNAAHTAVLVSSYRSGVFESEGLSLRKSLANYSVNAICDCGGWRWLGTNAGLIRLKGEEVVTYTEEGVKGFEIPDNVVDGLFCPSAKRLVAYMPEAIDFFELSGEESASHGNHFDFVGERGNAVSDAMALPDASLLLLTDKGLLYLGKQFAEGHHHGDDHGFKEVFSSGSAAQALPLAFGDGGWKKGFIDSKGNAWLASPTSVAKLKSKKLLKLAQRKPVSK